jgi:hypothetical protein
MERLRQAQDSMDINPEMGDYNNIFARSLSRLTQLKIHLEGEQTDAIQFDNMPKSTDGLNFPVGGDPLVLFDDNWLWDVNYLWDFQYNA